jgi:hypothetical protein
MTEAQRTHKEKRESGVAMAEYQDILRFLALNPPHHEPEKRLHASVLETLARKLRGEEVKIEPEVLKVKSPVPNYMKRYH